MHIDMYAFYFMWNQTMCFRQISRENKTTVSCARSTTVQLQMLKTLAVWFNQSVGKTTDLDILIQFFSCILELRERAIVIASTDIHTKRASRGRERQVERAHYTHIHDGDHVVSRANYLNAFTDTSHTHTRWWVPERHGETNRES